MMSYEDGETYFVFEGKSNGSLGKTKRDLSPTFTIPSWEPEDVMTIKWDSNEGTFIYYRNDKQEGTMDIDKGLIYYPCVCKNSHVAIEIEILP